ncbi:MAG: multiple sugar transport system permease protein, partial [Massilia sp.]
MSREATILDQSAMPSQAAAGGGGRAARTEDLPAMLLLAPFIVAFLLFFLAPALQTFYLSLTESSLTRTNAFVGLANYATLAQ